MNKKELVSTIAKEVGCEQAVVTKVLSSYQRTILSELKEDGDEAVLMEIGKLKVKHRTARAGVNLKTKEKITIAAKNCPKFVPSKKLKSMIEKKDGINFKSFNY